MVPENPDLDRAPMPLYEAARMSSGDEEAFFEKWLLSDLDLCRDVAEFAAFSHALRAGAFRTRAPQLASPTPSPLAAASTPAPAAPVERDRFAPRDDEDGQEKPPAGLVLWSALGVILVLFVILFALFTFTD